jgi:hypothetical protein
LSIFSLFLFLFVFPPSFLVLLVSLL